MERSPTSSQLPTALWMDSSSDSEASPQASPSGYSYQPTEAELIHEWLKPYGIDVSSCDCCGKRKSGESPRAETAKQPSKTQNFEDLLDRIIKETILECEEEEKLAKEEKEAALQPLPRSKSVEKVQKQHVKRKLFPEIQPEQEVKKQRTGMKTVSLGAPSNLYSYEVRDIQANLVRLAEEQSRHWAMNHNNPMADGIY